MGLSKFNYRMPTIYALKRMLSASIPLLLLTTVVIGANTIAAQDGQGTLALTAYGNTREIPEIKQINNTSKPFTEIASFFRQLAQHKGAEYAYNVLKSATLPPNTELHVLGHTIGEELYKQQGAAGIALCTDDFRNACSHSIVVGLFLEKGESALSEIGEVCRKAPGTSTAYKICYHGLGHGVLAYAGYDLPKAVTLCSKTDTKEGNYAEARQCISGSIMELISGGFHDQAAWRIQRQKYLLSEKPEQTCLQDFLPESARDICFLYLTPYLLDQARTSTIYQDTNTFAYTDGLKKAFSFCDRLTGQWAAYRQPCYGGFGKEFTVIINQHNIQTLNNITEQQAIDVYKLCELSEDMAGTQACIKIALDSIYWGGQDTDTGALRFCKAQPNDTAQAVCFQRLLLIATAIRGEAYVITSLCPKLPDSQRKLCALS